MAEKSWLDWESGMSPESMVTFRSRMMAVWGPNDLFCVPYAQSIRMGMNEDDARILDQLGFPRWAAPNIWIHPPTKNSGESLCIGEDSEDREILYAANSGSVFVSDTVAGKLSVAPSILDFLSLLLELAELIEKGIVLCGPDVFTDGRLPNVLIAKFWESVKTRLGAEGAEKSIWLWEVERMSKNSS
jgi:hypothetical protein